MSSKNRTIYGLYHTISYMKQVSREARKMKHALLPLTIVLLLLTLSSGTIVRSSYHNYIPLMRGHHETSAGFPNVTLTYTTLWSPTETVVHAGDRLAGDHIVLHARWVPSAEINTSILSVNATVVPKEISAENKSAVVSIDTRSLGNNFTCRINMTAILANGSIITTLIDNVFLGNFFAPEVQVISPNGGEVWTGINNITWAASDKNVDETLTFDIFVSTDGGLTLMLLASGVNKTWYLWDCSAFTISENYTIAVRAFDGIYYTMDMSDGPFTAGGIPPTTVTTTIPTTTTTGTTTTTTAVSSPVAVMEGPILTFLLAALISSVAMALFVYYSAKKWI